MHKPDQQLFNIKNSINRLLTSHKTFFCYKATAGSSLVSKVDHRVELVGRVECFVDSPVLSLVSHDVFDWNHHVISDSLLACLSNIAFVNELATDEEPIEKLKTAKRKFCYHLLPCQFAIDHICVVNDS